MEENNIPELYHLDHLGRYFTVSDNSMQYIAESKQTYLDSHYLKKEIRWGT